MGYTRILHFRTNDTINGRKIQVETKQSCYYRYIIHPGSDVDWSIEYKKPGLIIKSDWIYTSGIGAFSAGKCAAKKLPAPASIINK